MKYRNCTIKLYEPEVIFDLSPCPAELINLAEQNNRNVAFGTIRGALNKNVYIEYTGRNRTYQNIRKIIDRELLSEPDKSEELENE